MNDALGRMVAALDSRLAIVRAGEGTNTAVRQHELGYYDLVAAAGTLGLSECQGVLL